MLLRGTGGENSKHNRCWSQVSKLISPGSLASRTRASESIFPTLPTYLLLRDWEQVISRNPSLAYRPEEGFSQYSPHLSPWDLEESKQFFWDIPILPIHKWIDSPTLLKYTSQRELGRIDTFFWEIPVLLIDQRIDSPNTPHTFPHESWENQYVFLRNLSLAYW